MAETTSIEWTDATWSPITGCSVISPGCTNCYAMKLAGTRLQHHPSRAGLTRDTKAGPVWTGEVRLNEGWIGQPLRWTKPRDIFVVAHGDLFHRHVSVDWIDRVFAIMALAPRHRFQVLTKRPYYMVDYLADRARLAAVAKLAAQPDSDHPNDSIGSIGQEKLSWPLSNVWIGTSIEDELRAKERWGALADLARRGWNTWVSYEPALGPVDWHRWDFIKWLVSGGENGPRPSHPDWHRAARDFCALSGIPYYFKQWGTWAIHLDRDEKDPDWRAPYSQWERSDQFRFLNLAGGCGFHGERLHVMRRTTKKAAGATLDGREWKEMPQ